MMLVSALCFSPWAISRPERITPVHNITDDLSWIHGNQLVVRWNFRKVNNWGKLFRCVRRTDTNPSFYAGAGDQFPSILDISG